MSPDKKLFVLIICSGAALSIVYVIYALRKKKALDFLKVATTFASVAGFIGGVKLCCLLIADDSKFLVDWNDKLIIFIGGLAVCWMSGIGYKDCFK